MIAYVETCIPGSNFPQLVVDFPVSLQSDPMHTNGDNHLQKYTNVRAAVGRFEITTKIQVTIPRYK